MDNYKEIDDKRNDMKWYSLAETSNAENIEYYEGIINAALSYDDDNMIANKNIAIMGGYGSGKSSIIKTYFAKNNEYKVLYVSLASYLETINKFSIYKNIDFIETSILQQIIYSEKPSKLPFSRINRIDKNHKLIPIFNLVLSFFLTIFLVLVFCIINYNGTVKIVEQPFLFILFCLFSLPMVVVINYILNLFYNSKINKVSINDIDINTEASDISILNRNIDELIHFFKCSDCKIVVFEDIDRLKESTLIFSKLKEINHIINQSLDKKEVLRFIYCIGDNVFNTSEIRTKFFDIIVPIIPYAGIGNFIDVLSKKLKIIDMKDEEYIKTIPYYLNNTREISDIINEFNVYYSNIKKINDEDKRELLYLITYKVLFPERYNWLVNGKGKLFYYFTGSFKQRYKDYYLKNINDNIKELEAKIQLKKEHHNENNQMLIYVIKGKLAEKGINVSMDRININNKNSNSVICNMQDFYNKPKEYISVIKNNDISFYYGGLTINDSEVFTSICKTDYCELIRINIEESEGQTLTRKLINLQKEKDKYNYNNISSSLKLTYLKNITLEEKYMPRTRYYDTLIQDTDLNDFESFLITREIIKDNYSRLINIKHDNSINENDENIITSIKNGKSLEKGNYYIDDISRVVNSLSYYDYYNDSSCLLEIFEYLVNNNMLEDIMLQQFFNNINTFKIKFLLELQKNNINVFGFLHNNIINLWDNIDGDKNFSELEIFELLKYTIISRIIPYDEIDHNEYLLIHTYITTTNHFIEYLDDNYESIKEELPKYKEHLLFDSIIIPDEGHNRIKKLLYDNGMYEKNIFSLAALSSIKELKFDYSRVFESAIDNGKESAVYDIVFNNIDNTIEDINRDGKLQDDSETTIVYVLNNFTIVDENIDLLLKNEINTNFNIKDFNNNLHDKIMNTRRFSIDWINLNYLYQENKDRFPTIMNIIEDKSELLIKQVLYFEEYKELFDAVLKSNNDKIDSVYNYILKDQEFNSIPDYPTRIIKIIINNDCLNIDNENDINIILNSNEYDDIDKSNVIIKNIENIDKMNLENITISIISNVVSSNVKNQYKINLATKYYGFEDDTINNRLFDILLNEKLKVEVGFLSNVLRSIEIEEQRKIELFNIYYDTTQKELMHSLLPYIGQKTRDILERKLNIRLSYNKSNKDYLTNLIDLGIISSYNHGKKGLSIRYKK